MAVGSRPHLRLKIALLAAGLAIGAVASPVGSAVGKTIDDVFVTNDTTHPVPTAAQGTTTVAGSVAVTNTVPVTGTVMAAPGVPGTPFAARATAEPSPTLITVPAGKTLVVETISVYLFASTSFTAPQFPAFVDFSTAGHAHRLNVPGLRVFSDATHNEYAVTQQVRVYADGGTTVQISVPGNTSRGQMTVTGYLI